MFDNLSAPTGRKRSTTAGAVVASLVFHVVLLAAAVNASGVAERLDFSEPDELRLAETPEVASAPQPGVEGEPRGSTPPGEAFGPITDPGGGTMEERGSPGTGAADRVNGSVGAEELRGAGRTVDPAGSPVQAAGRLADLEVTTAEGAGAATPPAGRPVSQAAGDATSETPGTLRLGERYRVRFRLPPTPPREPDPSRSGEEEADLGGERIVRAAYAELTGAGFRVEAQAPSLQAVDSLAPTEWSWEVTPREPGRYPLSLTVDAVVETEGDFEAMRIRTASEEHVVRATPLQRVSRWVADHGWWLGTAVLLLVFGWVRERRKWRATAPEEEVAFDEPAPEAEPARR